MGNIDLPQLAVPFTIGRDGPSVVEQDSTQNVTGNVYNIAVCPQGYRDDYPSFGIPEVSFHNMPLQLGPLEQALRTHEPAADLSIEQQRIAVGQAGVTVTVE